eukprot:m.227877 g.227877  ORF g.227877 m.227877 type:complete len:635 (+) comp25958_c0_seq2:139-2043(+)
MDHAAVKAAGWGGDDEHTKLWVPPPPPMPPPVVECPLPTVWNNRKLRRIATIGVLMALYSVAEIGISTYLNSLVMFSDGLHNGSDCLALLVAFWAEKMKLSPAKLTLTYGYRRMEILGGFVNGVFLLCIAVFVLLQSISMFIRPGRLPTSRMEVIMFIAASATGIVINIIGVTLFADTHTHGGAECSHGHSDGGHDEHAHTPATKKVATYHDGHDETSPLLAAGRGLLSLNDEVGSAFPVVSSGHGHGGGGHGHSHGGASCNGDSHSSASKPAVAAVHGHGHADHTNEAVKDHEGHGHSHGNGHAAADGAQPEPVAASSEGHGHGHGAEPDPAAAVAEGHGHGHGHGAEPEPVAASSEGHGHGHGHGAEPEPIMATPEGHGHGHGHSSGCTGDVGHGDHGGHDHDSHHGHGHGAHGHDEHAHGAHGHEEHGIDHNMWGLFAHFLGDVFTSFLVLGTGLTYWFAEDSAFAPYADPTCSVLSSFIIFYTGWGVTKACTWILLQAAPPSVNTSDLTNAILEVDDIVDVHELHVWQLVDNLSLATLHIVIREGTEVSRINTLVDDVRRVLHAFKVHVSTIQQEIAISAAPPHYKFGECTIGKSGCIEACEAENCCPDEVMVSKAEAATLRRRVTHSEM